MCVCVCVCVCMYMYMSQCADQHLKSYWQTQLPTSYFSEISIPYQLNY